MSSEVQAPPGFVVLTHQGEGFDIRLRASQIDSYLPHQGGSSVSVGLCEYLVNETPEEIDELLTVALVEKELCAPLTLEQQAVYERAFAKVSGLPLPLGEAPAPDVDLPPPADAVGESGRMMFDGDAAWRLIKRETPPDELQELGPRALVRLGFLAALEQYQAQTKED